MSYWIDIVMGECDYSPGFGGQDSYRACTSVSDDIGRWQDTFGFYVYWSLCECDYVFYGPQKIGGRVKCNCLQNKHIIFV